MKLAKVLSAAAALSAAAVLACSASAELVVPESPAEGMSVATGMWMIKMYCPSEGIDRGIDVSEIGTVIFTIRAAEPEWFEGNTGGGVVLSCGPTSVTPADHNWASANWWGVDDAELEINTVDATAAAQAVKVGDYTYQISVAVDDTNCIYKEIYDSEDGYAQIALQEWGSDMSTIAVDYVEFLDKSGNSMAKYDGNGNLVSGSTATTTPDTSADTDTTAPSADKGSPDTGVEGIAAVAGLAAVAAGAVVLSRKRK